MIVPIHPHLKVYQGPNHGQIPYCYCVLVDDQIRVLIDSGCGPDLTRELREYGIDIIVNTHFHLDHTGSNQKLGQVQVWCHHLDAPGIQSLETYLNMFGFAAFGAEEQGCQMIKKFDHKAGPVHRELSDGDLLNFGSTCLRVVHTPGHTSGHCCFFEEESGILISGDIDLSSFGPWYGHLCSDLDEFIASIEKCLELNPSLVISGHKGIIKEDIRTKFMAYRDCIFHKEERVLNALSKPVTLDELTARRLFYGPELEVPANYRVFEKQAIYKHLERLMRQGLVSQYGALFFRAGII